MHEERQGSSMSTYHDSWRPSRARRRSRRLLAGGLVAGSLVAAAAGLVGVTGAAAARDLPHGGENAPAVRDDHAHDEAGQDGPGRRSEPDRAAAGRTEAGRDGPGGREAPDGRDGPEEGERAERDRAARAVSVPCDSSKLIVALVRVNAEGGGALRLAPKCTYHLTDAFQQPDEYDGGIRDAREAADTA